MDIDNKGYDIKKEFLRFFSFWPYFILSVTIFLMFAYFYIRYSNYEYESLATIEILDKAQDSEMALPTAMTVFNRSMINLENEVGILSSYSLHKKVVNSLDSNIKFFTVGRLRTTEAHFSEWFNDFDFNLKIDPDTISTYKSFNINFIKNKMSISFVDKFGKEINYLFEKQSTLSLKNDLPFELTVRDNLEEESKTLTMYPVDNIIDSFRSIVKIAEIGNESDQLSLRMRYSNRLVADSYLNTVLFEFDRDGIIDRQLEYKRTMDFVDTRSVFLNKELEQIENRRQAFKENNNITDIKQDASLNITQQFSYDSELFQAKSQRDLLKLLEESLDTNEYRLIPLNIGLDNNSINQSIEQYNLVAKERDRYLMSAGPNNLFVKSLEDQLLNFSKNILTSIENYDKSLQKTINNLEEKEREFARVYQNIPENEKILRAIERELEIKEKLFLLLLQKKEEAAINFAVVKPSIKIIDNARTSISPVSPNVGAIYISSFIIGIIFPIGILYLRFTLDSKIHTRETLAYLLDNIPIIGELPHIVNKDDLSIIFNSTSRHPLAEAIRIVIANLNFVFSVNKRDKKSNIILVTSSIKGEGKTVVSVNISSLLFSKSSKVLLIGADLRNPQIHKFLNIDKKVNGLSDYIYKESVNWQDFIVNVNNLEILLSGTIPPNPTELLASEKFAKLLEEASEIYDYIVIDSAPCLLVSDTFEISKHVDTTLYVVRSNFSETNLCEFINETKNSNKLPGINVVFNSVGNSRSYGYKYGYQYGYKYGYKYGYNYGYGYGYSEEN